MQVYYFEFTCLSGELLCIAMAAHTIAWLVCSAWKWFHHVAGTRFHFSSALLGWMELGSRFQISPAAAFFSASVLCSFACTCIYLYCVSIHVHVCLLFCDALPCLALI